MANMVLEARWERRSATMTLRFDNTKYGIKAGEATACYVLGLFPATDEEGPNPYFVVELLDGRVMFADPPTIRFATEEGY